MPKRATDEILRNIMDPFANKIFLKLYEEGYVLDIMSPYRDDFEFANYDNWCKPGKTAMAKLLYAVFDKKTNELLKIGWTGDLEYRSGKGYDLTKVYLVPFVDFHLLDESTDAFLQEQYHEVVTKIRSDHRVPEPVRKLFEMIAERGGEELGDERRDVVHLLDR